MLSDRGVSTDNTHWSDRGLCRSDPDLFFPHKGDHETADRAKAICGRCPVWRPCLVDALKEPTQWGIRGGTSGRTRTELLRRRTRVLP